MASDNGAPREGWDDRLAEARDGALQPGEEVVAQETGDQGQAIVLTRARVLVVKVGLTTTGSLDGRQITSFPLEQITAVNVRKGPMGAVIQICSKDTTAPAPTSGPPANVVVFSGDKSKRCEPIASAIQALLGKPVEILAPSAKEIKEVEAAASGQETESAKPRRGGREAVPLALEMFQEMTESPDRRTEPTEAAHAVQAEQRTEAYSEIDQPPESDIPSDVFGPNPFLPKPVRRGNRASRRLAVVVGACVLLMLLGLSIVAPLRKLSETPTPTVEVSDPAHDVAAASARLTDVTKYRAAVKAVLAKAETTRSALRSSMGSKAALSSALAKDNSDEIWAEMSNLKAPPGMAAAKQKIASGLFMWKALATSLSNEVQAGQSDEGAGARVQMARSDAAIKEGLAMIDASVKELEARIKPAEPAK